MFKIVVTHSNNDPDAGLNFGERGVLVLDTVRMHELARESKKVWESVLSPPVIFRHLPD